MIVLSAFAFAGMAFTGVASAESAQGEFNCSDFGTWAEAQAVLEQDPSDPHGLDADNDGIACEDLPGAPDDGETTTTAPPEQPPAEQPAVEDKDCDDYASQAEAQGVLSQDPRDPHNLDADNDGQACERFFAPAPSTEEQQVAVHPVGGVATGGDTGEDDSALVVIGALAALFGAGAVVVVRRRAQGSNKA
ncbi:hypothetical protein BA062_02685 [Prauserella flavalba]|uniref:Excalibur calcium-binding domain-containing protein n=2 Tax=Prauserella flavalba TaxID=1477506 RepID=A0A318LWE4_9PSEU|nr:hypothetical protein BA062_02685 [Prauserella flavalba]